MSTELLVLILTTLLCLLLPMIYSALYTQQVGIKGNLGNRDNIPEPTGAAARGRRAHQNLLENLLPFAIVVLVAQHLGISNNITVNSALVFLAARVVHALCYFFGITGLRSAAHMVSLIATLVIVWQLF